MKLDETGKTRVLPVFILYESHEARSKLEEWDALSSLM